MRITLFTENYYRGGVDTFIVTLLNNWSHEADEFTLVCNETHPGIDDICERLRRPCRIVTHRIATYAGLAARTSGVVDFIRRASSPVTRYLYLGHAVRALRPVLCDGVADRLIVVNGGYPGGDTCRAAGIAWGLWSGRPGSIHNFHNLATTPPRFARAQENYVDALLARHTRFLVTVSRAAADSMSVRPEIWRLSEKVMFIQNGIEAPAEGLPSTDFRAELGLPPGTPLCLVLGTYEPRKGHRFLLEVFRRVTAEIPAAHLVFCGYGSGEEMASVAACAADAGIAGNVHVLGFRRDAMQILRQADLLLIGSQEFESFGLTAVEAMARRVPVVATRVGGIPEVVADGQGGFCTGKDAIDSYSGCVLQFLRDERLRKEQGDKGFCRYRQLFTAERMAREYAAIVRE